MNKQDTQCLKGLGILYMLIFHVFSQGGHMGGMKYLFANENILNTFSMGCQLCVSVFVFVSAYGTAMQYREKNIDDAVKITKYTGNRYIKLMMEYWFVYILAFLFAIYKHQIELVYGIGNWNYIFIDFMGMYMKHSTPTLNESWWFMSMAVTLVFILPVFILIQQKIGFIVSALMGWAAYYSFNLGLADYFYVVILGVGLAQCDIMAKILIHAEHLHSWKKGISVLVCLTGMLFIPFFRNTVIQEFVYSNPVHMFCLCVLTCIFIRTCFMGKKILLFLGRHATNLWLIHVFIYSKYYSDLVYRWKYHVIILGVLLCLSLLVSVFIEYIKKIVHYKELSNWLCRKWDKIVEWLGMRGGV